jgi:hypothetical protein
MLIKEDLKKNFGIKGKLDDSIISGNYWTGSLVCPTVDLNVMEKSFLPLPGFETINVQLVPSSCTYYAIPTFYASVCY